MRTARKVLAKGKRYVSPNGSEWCRHSGSVIIAEGKSAAQIDHQVRRTYPATLGKHTELFVFPRYQNKITAARIRQYALIGRRKWGRGTGVSYLSRCCQGKEGLQGQIQDSTQMWATAKQFLEVS